MSAFHSIISDATGSGGLNRSPNLFPSEFQAPCCRLAMSLQPLPVMPWALKCSTRIYPSKYPPPRLPNFYSLWLLTRITERKPERFLILNRISMIRRKSFCSNISPWLGKERQTIFPPTPSTILLEGIRRSPRISSKHILRSSSPRDARLVSRGRGDGAIFLIDLWVYGAINPHVH